MNKINEPVSFSSFISLVLHEIFNNLSNIYSTENYDSDRFGKISLRKKIKNSVLRTFNKNNICMFKASNLKTFTDKIEWIEKVSYLYVLLEDEYSKKLLVKLVVFRLLGNTRVKLPTNTKEFWDTRKMSKELICSKETLDSGFKNWRLNYFDLNKIGRNIKLYARGVNSIFMLKQYEYHNTSASVKAEKGDEVIDAGGCWGDTALYFAEIVGEKGAVHSFEFCESNLNVFYKNLELNPVLSPRIRIVKNALYNISGELMNYKETGPGTHFEINNKKAIKQVETITVDDYVEKNKINRIDFIKMDIEGAELYALQGAERSIKRYLPKLAISLYHKPEDFYLIPEYLHSLELGYHFYLGHYTIHKEETVLFAKSFE